MEIIYQKAGLRRVINASGRMTALGVSTIHDETGKTMVEAAQNYVVIDELIEADTSLRISAHLEPIEDPKSYEDLEDI